MSSSNSSDNHNQNHNSNSTETKTKRMKKRYHEKVANIIVANIDRNVSSMMKSSNLMKSNTSAHNCDDEFGLFSKKELRLGKLLGRGGFSSVYEIQNVIPKEEESDSSTPRRRRRQCIRNQFGETNPQYSNQRSNFVVKQLRSKLIYKGTTPFLIAASDLVMEGHLLREMSHPNIITIHGWATGGAKAYQSGYSDAYFLILERLEETLGQRIRTWKKLRTPAQSKDLLLNRAVGVVQQIASALKYLHEEKNMVFRDLKPDNVGFDRSGTVKLFDFGLSRELPSRPTNKSSGDPLYRMSGRVGTARFMAPECLQSKPYNKKVDTYSLAILLWTCLTLEKAYEDMDAVEHLEFVCVGEERPPLDKEWPRDLRMLLQNCWTKSIDNRWSMSQVVAALKSIQEDRMRQRKPSPSTSIILPPTPHRRCSSAGLSPLPSLKRMAI